MQKETRKRGWIFTLVMSLAACLFSLVVTVILDMQWSSVIFIFAATCATFLTSRFFWPRYMRANESRKNGAKAGGVAVFYAYPLMGALALLVFSIADTTRLSLPEFVPALLGWSLLVGFFGLILTGWAAIPIGWTIGKTIARDTVDMDVFD